MGKDIDVGYILSLGVHKKHRRNGIGSLLLDALLRHLTTSDRARVKAIFLHVLTTNQAAILFYESRNFRMHSFLPYYYLIRGNCKDGFTYVSYINGGHPPWTLIGNERNERRHFPHRHIFKTLSLFSQITWKIGARNWNDPVMCAHGSAIALCPPFDGFDIVRCPVLILPTDTPPLNNCKFVIFCGGRFWTSRCCFICMIFLLY